MNTNQADAANRQQRLLHPTWSIYQLDPIVSCDSCGRHSASSTMNFSPKRLLPQQKWAHCAYGYGCNNPRGGE